MHVHPVSGRSVFWDKHRWAANCYRWWGVKQSHRLTPPPPPSSVLLFLIITASSSFGGDVYWSLVTLAFGAFLPAVFVWSLSGSVMSRFRERLSGVEGAQQLA